MLALKKGKADGGRSGLQAVTLGDSKMRNLFLFTYDIKYCCFLL